MDMKLLCALSKRYRLTMAFCWGKRSFFLKVSNYLPMAWKGWKAGGNSSIQVHRHDLERAREDVVPCRVWSVLMFRELICSQPVFALLRPDD